VVIFLLLVLFFLFFPYVTPVSFGTDIQPWGIILTTVFLTIILFRGYKIKKILIFLLAPMILSVALFPFEDNQFSAIRSIAGYFTIALIPILFYYALKRHYEITVTFLKLAVVVYLFVGIVQFLFDHSFMTFLLSRGGGYDASRGVLSLSTEPTFYGLICLFLILTFSALETSNKYKYIYLLLFQIIFLAQSSMVILFLLIFVFIYILFRVRVKLYLITFLCGVIIFLFLNFITLDLRAINLFNQAIMHPERLMLDGSINSRIGAIYFSIKGFIDSYGMANGFSNFSDYWAFEILRQDVFFQSARTPPVRIMSFYGGILFELGIVGLLIPFTYSVIIFKAYKANIRDFLIFFFFLNAILFTAIPMSFSLVGIYFGALIYKAEDRDRFGVVPASIKQ
jgi:hypothetical protein